MSRAACIPSAFSITGRSSSWTACQSKPPGLVCQCLSRTVFQTYSKESILSRRCSGVSANAHTVAGEDGSANLGPTTKSASFFLEHLGAQRSAQHGERREKNEEH